jgi:DNA (cytosine-5)-methyltransferase 1
LKYLSVCSGIEAATVAWHPLGWEAVAYSEIEKFPSEVLAHHYPNTPNLGDMTKFKEWTNVSNVDLLVGGTPCQSFSVAGLRKGLDDPRGNLMLTYLAIAKQYRPNWLVWENVPGVLSSNGGRDFGSFLGGLAECGYGFAYRVLDAQFFGVAQRRRRVFVVGHLGDWRAAAAVLFERHSLQGHPAPSREKRQAVAPSISTGAPFSRTGNERVEADAMVVTPKWWDGGDLAATITTKSDDQRMPDKANAQLVMQPVYEMHGQDSRVRELGETCTTVTSKWGTGGGNVPVALQPIALAENTIGRQPHNGGNGDGFTDGGPMYTLNATGVHGVAQPIAYNISPGKGALKEDIHVTDADATKTLDASASNPAMHQGGTAIVQPISFSGQMSNPQTDVDMTQTLQAKNPMAVAQPVYSFIQASAQKKSTNSVLEELSNTLTARAENNNFAGGVSMAVRRLTPVECERLQGFPDSYTDIRSKNKPTPDGPRYKALGNSMAVPVMAWIGARIQQYEDMQ